MLGRHMAQLLAGYRMLIPAFEEGCLVKDLMRVPDEFLPVNRQGYPLGRTGENLDIHLFLKLFYCRTQCGLGNIELF